MDMNCIFGMVVREEEEEEEVGPSGTGSSEFTWACSGVAGAPMR